MAKVTKMEKVAATEQTELPAQPVDTAPEKQFVIGEKALSTMVNALLELKARDANPIITFINQNFKELTSAKEG